MRLLSRSLTRSFDTIDGSMDDLLDDNFNIMEKRYHKDLRAFHTHRQTTPWTMLDMKLHGNTYFSRYKMIDFDGVQRIVHGGSQIPTTMTFLDSLLGASLEGMTMGQLEWMDTGMGDEDWSIDADVTVSNDSSARYIPTLSVHLTGGVEKIVTSHYQDDILTGLDNPFSTYFIELPVVGSTGTSGDYGLGDYGAGDYGTGSGGGGGTLSPLADSSLIISSSRSFDPAVTDELLFDASESDVYSTGYLRWNRDLLVNADLSNIKAVKLKLNAAVTMTVKFRNLRVIDGGYSFQPIDIDTKTGTLSRSVPRDGITEPVDPFGTIWFPEVRPKNVRQLFKFNSGHNPVGNDNIIKFYARNTDDYQVRVDLLARSTQSRLRIYETIDGVETEIYSTATLTHILAEQRDYFLVVELDKYLIRATIYGPPHDSGLGAFLGNVVYTTDWKPLTHNVRGGMGFDFRPYNYDFFLYYTSNQEAQFAIYNSTAFASVTPVIGATLAVTEKEPVDLIEDLAYMPSGDGLILYDDDFEAYKISRSGNLFWGGIEIEQSVDITNSVQYYFTGEIYPTTTRGNFRIVLMDENEVVAFIGYLRDLRINTWNQFLLPVNMDIVNRDYRVLVHQDGFYPDVFYLRNLKLNSNTIGWQVSGDNTNWMNFRHLINDRFDLVELPAPSTNIFLKAIAYSDETWISSFELIPFYKTPGHN